MRIRTKLTVQFIGISAGILLIAHVFVFQQFRRYVTQEFYAQLESKGRMTAEMVLRREKELRPIYSQAGGKAATLPSIGNVTIFNQSYRCVFALNPGAGFPPVDEIRRVPARGASRVYHGQFLAVGIQLTAPSGSLYYVVSEDIPDFSKLKTLGSILLLSLLFVIAAVAAGGWFFAGQALAPVSHIVREVDTILPDDLSKRVKHNNNRDELSHLVGTFNDMLDRMERAFRLQRGFISNVSHELKNPIATMDAQLQLARHKSRSTEEYERILASLHEDIRDMSESIEKLLQLARLHSGVDTLRFSDTRLDEMLYQGRQMILKANPGYQVQIEIVNLPDHEQDLCVRGDESLLRIALANLLDNCCKFSTDRKAKVVLDFSAPFPLTIEDNGPGIAAEDLPYIFEPFFRCTENSQVKGSGIGLSLVASILQLHGIEIKVESSPGQGTKYLLGFRASADKAAVPEIPVEKPNRPGVKWLVLALALSATGCSDTAPVVPPSERLAVAVAQDWNALFLEMAQFTPGYRPPVSARMFGYMGIAGWEAALPAMHGAQSLGFVDNADLKKPLPLYFIAAASLHAAYSDLSYRFFPNAPARVRHKRSVLEKKWGRQIAALGTGADASAQYGKAVARSIFAWAESDTVGRQGALTNYGRYDAVVKPGTWSASKEALLPEWGHARTLLVAPEGFAALPPKRFSESKYSAFFAQAMELYALAKPLSSEERRIAEYWSNDVPNLTFDAASRWVAIAHQVIGEGSYGLQRVMETYLKMGCALNDITVKVWKVKYAFALERPDTYIQRNIDPSWQPVLETPLFPAYPSGHSAFGAAAAAVLERLFGYSYTLTDRSLERCPDFKATPRKYTSFAEMANENALSRLYMGVHYRMDCEEGLRLGRLVGQRIADFPLTFEGKLAEHYD
jgi:signal transduction histidine kinase